MGNTESPVIGPPSREILDSWYGCFRIWWVTPLSIMLRTSGIHSSVFPQGAWNNPLSAFRHPPSEEAGYLRWPITVRAWKKIFKKTFSKCLSASGGLTYEKVNPLSPLARYTWDRIFFSGLIPL